MKYLLFFCGLAGVLVYFFGGSGGGAAAALDPNDTTATFEQEFDKPVDEVFAGIASSRDLGGRQAAALFTMSADGRMTSSVQQNRRIALTFSAGQQVAAELVFAFQPLDGGRRSKLTGTVETYKLEDDERPADLANASQLAFLIDAMLEKEATGTVSGMGRQVRLAATMARLQSQSEALSDKVEKIGDAIETRDEEAETRAKRDAAIARALREGKPMSEVTY